ncbi:hypothetical protein HFO56_00705 [Rhizobium laguerreae]|uniref:hypothetical protein n=1 Tax=Rhizobium laguerreae TaxID=1076926 RepID=UPI001C90E751|nr:hypothetical protein [Rhizobium laguerreae]MBY3150949.1 hypothetical protein [Rhizobium laguerreae]
MNTVDQLRNDISVLTSFATVKGREYTRRRDEIAGVLKAKKKELATARALVSATLVPPIMKELAAARKLWSMLFRGKALKLGEKANALEDDVRKLISGGRAAEQSRRTMAAVSGRLGRMNGELADLDHPPPEIAARLAGVASKVAALARKKDPKAMVDAARELVLCVDSWSKAGKLARRSGGADSGTGRIWLPIPFSMRSQAMALGAKQDMSVQGASRFFVNVGEPLGRFNSLLPHAFRDNPPRLSFSTIRATAQRQNLHGFLDPLSWDHIRNVNYSMTGRRCILCGKQSGNLVRKLEPEAGRVHPAVKPERLYQETAMRWITQPEPTYKVVAGR